MLFFRKPESENFSLIQQMSSFVFYIIIFAYPNRSQSKDGDLPRVPICQSVKSKNLIQGDIAMCVPAVVFISVIAVSKKLNTDGSAK